jgi:hypothetical protein
MEDALLVERVLGYLMVAFYVFVVFNAFMALIVRALNLKRPDDCECGEEEEEEYSYPDYEDHGTYTVSKF